MIPPSHSPMDSLAAFALAFLAGVFAALLWMAYLDASIEEQQSRPQPAPPSPPASDQDATDLSIAQSPSGPGTEVHL